MSDSEPTAGAVSPSAAPAKPSNSEPSALDRLTASRVRLRGALLSIAHPLPPQPLFSQGLGGFSGQVVNRLKSVPLAQLAIEAAEGWWRQHPLNKAGTVAVKTSMTLIEPYAKKEPFNTAAIAAVATVLVLTLKPWRLLFRPRVILSALGGIALYAIKAKSPNDWLRAVLPSRASR